MNAISNNLSSVIDLLTDQAPRRIVVIGDVMLDRYVWGCADRVSPEAPVLVLRSEQQEVRLGGAASVARLLRGLAVDVDLIGVMGDDGDGRTVEALLDEDRIERSAVFADRARGTTCKTRFMGRAEGRHPHPILRVDQEDWHYVVPELKRRLTAAYLEKLPAAQAVLISDYGKGVCLPGLLREVIESARAAQVPVLVDPARDSDWLRYQRATLIKPNRSELATACGRSIKDIEDARTAAWQCRERYALDAVVATLDRDGMLVASRQAVQHVPTRSREVYDVTGAGDVTLAVLGLCLASSVPLAQAAELANLAAGIEVEHWGVTPVSWQQLRREATRAQPPAPKLLAIGELAEQVALQRRRGARIVFTNGCFDLLHLGHTTCLQEAAQLGDVLVVAVNSDASVRRLKGSDRPVLRAEQRAAMVAALPWVNFVTICEDDTPHELLALLRPDVLVKGGTCSEQAVVGREIVEAYGGSVCVVSTVNGLSTTSILRSADRASFRRTTNNPVPRSPVSTDPCSPGSLPALAAGTLT